MTFWLIYCNLSILKTSNRLQYAGHLFAGGKAPVPSPVTWLIVFTALSSLSLPHNLPSAPSTCCCSRIVRVAFALGRFSNCKWDSGLVWWVSRRARLAKGDTVRGFVLQPAVGVLFFLILSSTEPISMINGTAGDGSVPLLLTIFYTRN